jgi:hypothetical protein
MRQALQFFMEHTVDILTLIRIVEFSCQRLQALDHVHLNHQAPLFDVVQAIEC